MICRRMVFNFKLFRELFRVDNELLDFELWFFKVENEVKIGRLAFDNDCEFSSLVFNSSEDEEISTIDSPIFLSTSSVGGDIDFENLDGSNFPASGAGDALA